MKDVASFLKFASSSIRSGHNNNTVTYNANFNEFAFNVSPLNALKHID